MCDKDLSLIYNISFWVVHHAITQMITLLEDWTKLPKFEVMLAAFTLIFRKFLTHFPMSISKNT